MGLYRTLVRPAVFSLPPEAGHRAVETLLQLPLPWRAIGGVSRDPRLRTELAGIEVPNPIGLAAGFDKRVTMLPHLEALGFGFAVAGTVTRRPPRSTLTVTCRLAGVARISRWSWRTSQMGCLSTCTITSPRCRTASDGPPGRTSITCTPFPAAGPNVPPSRSARSSLTSEMEMPSHPGSAAGTPGSPGADSAAMASTAARHRAFMP